MLKNLKIKLLHCKIQQSNFKKIECTIFNNNIYILLSCLSYALRYMLAFV
jgi:hypothetical protein